MSKSYVCVDFSLGSLTCVEVRENRVLAWFEQALPETAIRHGEPADPQGLGSLLAELMTVHGMTARRARMAIPDQASVIQVLKLPRMSQREIHRAVAFAAERAMPLPIDECRWSWDLLGKSGDGTVVILACAWKDIVDRMVAVGRAAGLECQVVEPRSLAVSRALSLPEVIVLDGCAGRIQLTMMAPAQPPFIDQAALDADPQRRSHSLAHLVLRALRERHPQGVDETMPPVVLAGELEGDSLRFSQPALRASELLARNAPTHPDGMQPGAYLANLGLAMRSQA